MPSFRSLLVPLLFALALFATPLPLKAAAGTLSGGPNGALHRLGPDSTLLLAPGSQARLLPKTKLDLGGGAPVPAVSVALERGVAEVIASAPKTQSAVLIRAPGKVACAVAATRAIISARAGSVAVAAPDAEIVVALGDDWRPLAPGQLRAFGPAESGAAQPILAPPSAPATERVMLDGGAPERIQWSPVAGARSYRVRVGARSVETRELVATIDGLSPGTHEVSVSAVDRFGIASKPAAAGRLRVIGIELPPGASRASSTVRLHAGQRLRLVGAEGLELTYGGSAYFVRAPRSVGLPPRGGTRVRLRARGASNEAELRLEPIVVSAHVALSPKLAHWPSDQVRARVTSDGVALSELEIAVSVNARPIRVSWQRDGDALVAVVPPEKDGPWVVRVEVRGPRGDVIGRDFVEVAQSRTRLASNRSQ